MLPLPAKADGSVNAVSFRGAAEEERAFERLLLYCAECLNRQFKEKMLAIGLGKRRLRGRGSSFRHGQSGPKFPFSSRNQSPGGAV